MRVLHAITSLSTGGAEHMLARLAQGLKADFTQQVISLTPPGPVATQIRKAGIEVSSLNVATALPNPFVLWRLSRLIRAFRPDVVQTWMYHADLLGGLAARLAGVKNIVWNIRNNDLARDTTKARTRWVVKACARLSRGVPRRIVSCAQSAAQTHIELGYAADKFVVIPNGFDLQRFHPDISARSSVRGELGLDADTPLVGLIARFDPQKNHQGFIQAAQLMHERKPGVHFLLAGRGVDAGNLALGHWIREAGLGQVTHLLGERDDIPRLNQALDIAVSTSSYGEAFPNVLGEAMACGVPVVSTDAGDAALIAGATGRIVPRHDMAALATACLDLLAMGEAERQALGQQAQRRIAHEFSLEVTVKQYAELYRSLRG